MKRFFVCLLATVLMCSAALAAPVVETSKDANDKTIFTVVLPGTDWDVIVEDPAVLDIGDADVAEDMSATYMIFAGIAPGVSGIELTNGVEEYSISAACDENGSLAILSVNDLTETADNIEDLELMEDEAVVTIVFSGDNWGFVIDNDNVVALASSEYDPETDLYTFSFLAGTPGVTDVAFTNGVDEEELTFAVNEDEEISVVTMQETDANAGFDVAVDADAEKLIVTGSGEWIADIANDGTVELENAEYDEATDTWTGTFTAKDNGTTELLLSDGSVAGTVTVNVTDGVFESAYTENTDIDVQEIVNPKNYEVIDISDIFVTEDGTIVVAGTLGSIVDGEKTGFGEDDLAILNIAPNAAIEVPANADASENTTCEDIAAWFAAMVEADENYSFTAAMTLDENGDVIALTCVIA